jgi:hypothetical protein
VEPADCARYELSDRGVTLGWIKMRCERGPTPPDRETDEWLRTLFRQASLAIARFHQQDHLRHALHWDGSGYPLGLERGEIPLIARIFSVADALDTITSDRPYRRARPAPSTGRLPGLR